MDKKQKQLGMNPSTASHRLIKDLLFDFILKGRHKCYKCDGKLTRETFSIEHIIPWLDSDNPSELFFSLDNIAYSHLSCNSRDARRNYTKAKHGTQNKYKSGCKCQPCKDAEALGARKRYTTEKRRIKYEKEKLKRNALSSNR